MHKPCTLLFQITTSITIIPQPIGWHGKNYQTNGGNTQNFLKYVPVSEKCYCKSRIVGNIFQCVALEHKTAAYKINGSHPCQECNTFSQAIKMQGMRHTLNVVLQLCNLEFQFFLGMRGLISLHLIL